MTLENINYGPDDIRSIVLGDNPATEADVTDLINYAQLVLRASPVLNVTEIEFTSIVGSLSLALVDESDTTVEHQPSVVISFSDEDPDEPYYLLEFDRNNQLLSPRKPEYEDEEYAIYARNFLEDLRDENEPDEFDEEEATILSELEKLADSALERTSISNQHESSVVNFVDLVRSVIRRKCRGTEHSQEVNGAVGNKQEVTVASSYFELAPGSSSPNFEELRPKLQIEFTDRNTCTRTFLVLLATDEVSAGVTNLLEDRVDYSRAAHRLLDSSMAVIDMSIINALTSALHKLANELAEIDEE